MTDTAEQASAQTEEQKAEKQTADGFAEREKKERERRQKEAADQAAEVRDGWRKHFAEQNVQGTMNSQFANTFIQMWQNVDASSVEFAAGMNNIIDFKPEKKAPGVITITSQAKNNFSYINNDKGEFIGLTQKQAKKTPLNEKTADDIALTALARGWTSVTVTGNQAEKDMLWVAAQKYGLAVKNYIPSPEAVKAYEDFKTQAANPSAGMEADTQTPSTPHQSTSKHVVATGAPREDVIDAEFTEIKPLAIPGSKIAGLLPPPPSNGGNDKGPPPAPPSPGR